MVDFGDGFDVSNRAILFAASSSAGVEEHRYWRINGITIPPTENLYLEITELQMLEDGVDVTASATKTGSNNPDVLGLFEKMFDGILSNASRVIWNVATATAPGFYIKFDFGVGVTKHVNGVKQGGGDGDTGVRYITGFTLQYSDDDSSWTTLGSKSGLSHPGVFTLSSEYSFP